MAFILSLFRGQFSGECLEIIKNVGIIALSKERI
jgi:hypothetical protein